MDVGAKRTLLTVGLTLAAVVVLSAAASLVFAVFPYPVGVRLDLAPGGEDYIIRWTTDEFGSQFGDDVTYGPADGSWSRVARGSSRTTLVWADSARWLRPMRVHDAVLEGLDAGVAYRYQVPRATPGAFLVPNASAIRVVAVGDIGISGEAARMASLAADVEPQLVVAAGDLAYASGDAEAWGRWLEIMEPLASRAPLMPARGNHDVEFPFGSRLLRANFPGRGSYHSYDAGPAHFVHLDTEISLSDEGDVHAPREGAREDAQEAWLRADLAEARARNASWIVAVFHEPAYSSGRNHGSNLAVRERWAPIFDEFGVDLAIQAHDHNYQRSHPLLGDALDANGTTYLVVGGGGRSLYDRFQEPAPAWTAVREAAHHFVQLDITGESIQGRGIGLDGGTIDEFTIYK